MRQLSVLIISFVAFSHSALSQAKNYQSLEDSLAVWAKSDQTAAGLPPEVNGKREFTPAFKRYKDSVYAANYEHIRMVFAQYGFPGTDRISRKAANDYWLIVQHLDKWPSFQQQVLDAMEPLLAGGLVAGSDFAYLTDRVRINTGRPQLYGTQVTYDLDSCQAKPKPLEDAAHVNERRKLAGMEPLEKYLNQMSTTHFRMNSDMYLKKGITGPKLYPVTL